MSMRSVVGLNKQLPSQAYMRVLASGMRGFHAGMSICIVENGQLTPVSSSGGRGRLEAARLWW